MTSMDPMDRMHESRILLSLRRHRPTANTTPSTSSSRPTLISCLR